MAGRPTRANRNAEQTDTPLMHRMAEAMTQLLETHGREDRYRSFLVHTPPAFMGGSNPMEAEEWIHRMEDIFEVMRCTDRDRVDLAAYMLREEAKHWWARYRDREDVLQAPTTWAQFKTLFLDKYFPSSLKDQKEREFLSLEQGDMTVAQYVAKFEELARFSDHLKLQANDEWKSKRFEQGLRPEVKSQVVTHRIRDYQQLVEVCGLAEQSVNDVRASRQAKLKRKMEDLNLKEQEPRDYVQRERKTARPGSSSYPVCKTCSRRHLGPCLRGKGVCYSCGKPGHVTQTFPNRVNRLGNAPRDQARGRVYTLNAEPARPSDDHVEGTS